MKIKIIFSDVDGVLTDGGMYYTESGDEFKKFQAHDGEGMRLLMRKGFKVGIITTEDRIINRNRAKKLRLDYDFHGIKDKLAYMKEFCIKEKIKLSEIAYIGDDINCFELLYNVGICACPKNAVKKVKSIPNIIKLKKSGGNGAFREFTEIFL
jgi:YrbI family 3-deoxy-D-manno-octulosonate 8-phosphate phosphatase